jgi:hypothetical protein
MNRTRTGKSIIIQTTPEMDNWMHPQTTERKQRIKDRMMAAVERYKKMTREEDSDPLQILKHFPSTMTITQSAKLISVGRIKKQSAHKGFIIKRKKIKH